MVNLPSLWSNPDSGGPIPPDPNPPSADESPRSLHKQLGADSSPFKKLSSVKEQPEIWLKDESARFGLPSFKILGASWGCYRACCKLLQLPLGTSLDDLQDSLQDYGTHHGPDKTTFWAATDGNHGRAVGWMASRLAVRAIIVVSSLLDRDAQMKIQMTGANLITVDADYDGAVKEAEKRAKESGGILIQDTAWFGYEQVPNWIVQGYATIFEEIDEDLASNSLGKDDIVIVPVGVGSLAHAAVRSLKYRENPVKVVTIEPENAACLNTSLHAEQPTTIKTKFTIMTGMNCGTVSYTAWPELHRLVDISLVVTEKQADAAVKLLEKQKVNTGPCGAACYAAYEILLANGLLKGTKRVIIINTEARRPYETPK